MDIKKNRKKDNLRLKCSDAFKKRVLNHIGKIGADKNDWLIEVIEEGMRRDKNPPVAFEPVKIVEKEVFPLGAKKKLQELEEYVVRMKIKHNEEIENIRTRIKSIRK